ncbi:MAG: hypothetical protein AAB668_00610 [Patescibacteria group bacterium]
MKSFLRRHGIAILLALLVGALSVAPHLLAVRALGDEYRGVPFMYVDDEDIYLTRMQEIVDGYPDVGSAFFYEYKDERPIQPAWGEHVYVALSRLTGLSLPDALVLAKFLFPAILFLLAYAFVWRLLPAESVRLRVVAASAGALLVALGYDLMSWRDALQLLQGEDIGLRLSLWTRPVNPILGGVGVFASLLLIWEVLEARSSKLEVSKSRGALVAASAGLVLGGLVFYFFAWGYVLSVLAFLGLGFLVQKDWKRLRDIGIVLLVSFLVSAPYWYGMFQSLGGAGDPALATRNGMFFTHQPLLNKTLLFALALFVVGSIVLTRWRDPLQLPLEKGESRFWHQSWWMMSASLLLGGLWALNQQILTGRMVWPYHFVQYTKPVVVIVLLVLFVRAFAPRFRKTVLVGCVVLGALALLQGALAAGTYRSVLDDFRERQREADIFAWLDENQPKDCVVVVKEDRERFTRQVPAFTHCNVYVSSWTFSGVPLERVEHNFFIHLRLLGVASEDAREFMLANPDLVRLAYFEDWNQVFETAIDDWLLGKIEEVVPAYQAFLEGNAAEQLRTYRANVLLSKEPLSEDELRQWRIEDEGMPIGGYRLYPL